MRAVADAQARVVELVPRLGDDEVAIGAALGAGELGLLAALGHARIGVGRAPSVAIVATGDELADVTVEPGFGQLVDSSAYALAAQVREAGGVPIYLGVARDDRAVMAE